MISAAEYAATHVGDQRSEVRDRLGRPRDPYGWFFPAPTARATCDYYSGSGSVEYQLCYRNDILTSTHESNHPR